MHLIALLARRVLRAGPVRAGLLITVLALTAGGAMFGAAGGRRAATSFDRLVEWSDPGDLTTSGLPGDVPVADLLPLVEALPQVETSWRLKTVAASAAELPDGRTVRPPRLNFSALDAANAGRSVDRVKVIEGRFPEASSVDEAVIDFVSAGRFELDIGDEVTLVFGDDDNAVRETIRIVGVVLSPDAFPTVSGWTNAVVVLMPGFVAAHPDWVDPWAESLVVHLEDGPASLTDFRESLADAGLGDLNLGRYLTTTREGAVAVTRLEAVVLWVAAGLAALTGLLLVSQLVRRQTMALAPLVESTRSLGVRRSELIHAAAARGAVLGAIGATVAVLIAVAGSPLAPIGLARLAEVDVGFHADVLVLGAGVLTVVGLTAAVGAVSMASLTRQPAPRADAQRTLPTPGRATTWFAVRRSLIGGAGRSGLGPVSLGVGLLVTTLIANVGLRGVADEPAQSGGSWDAFVLFEDPAAASTAERALLDIDVVDAVSRGGWTGFRSGQESVFSFVVDPAGGLQPTIRRGRAPRSDSEVALGRAAMRRLEVRIGDSIEVDLAPQADGADGAATTATVDVVGEAIVSSTLFQDVSPTDAAVITPGLSALIDGDADGELPFLISFTQGTLPQSGLDAVHAAFPPGQVAFSFARSERGDVRALEEVTGVVWLLGGLILAAVVLSLTHHLIVTAGENRRNLGILKTLGFTNGRLVSAGAAAGARFAFVNAMVGSVLGIAAGRVLWRQVADRLIVVPLDRIPGTQIALAVAFAAVTAGAGGAICISRAVSARPAVTLRSG